MAFDFPWCSQCFSTPSPALNASPAAGFRIVPPSPCCRGCELNRGHPACFTLLVLVLRVPRISYSVTGRGEADVTLNLSAVRSQTSSANLIVGRRGSGGGGRRCWATRLQSAGVSGGRATPPRGMGGWVGFGDAPVPGPPPPCPLFAPPTPPASFAVPTLRLPTLRQTRPSCPRGPAGPGSPGDCTPRLPPGQAAERGSPSLQVGACPRFLVPPATALSPAAGRPPAQSPRGHRAGCSPVVQGIFPAGFRQEPGQRLKYTRFFPLTLGLNLSH